METFVKAITSAKIGFAAMGYALETMSVVAREVQTPVRRETPCLMRPMAFA
jgi:hypothetical protein